MEQKHNNPPGIPTTDQAEREQTFSTERFDEKREQNVNDAESEMEEEDSENDLTIEEEDEVEWEEDEDDL